MFLCHAAHATNGSMRLACARIFSEASTAVLADDAKYENVGRLIGKRVIR